MPAAEVWDDAATVHAKAQPHRDSVPKEAQDVLDALAELLRDRDTWETTAETWEAYYELPQTLVPDPGHEGEFKQVHPYGLLPVEVRRAVDMVGDIVGVFQGYGE